MNTFLPFSSFSASAAVIDDRRLWRQVLECDQILKALLGRTDGYRNHPCTKMWEGWEYALFGYRHCVVDEWLNRRLMMAPRLSDDVVKDVSVHDGDRPPWLGDEDLHSEYRAVLLHKDPDHYGQFGWVETPKAKFKGWKIP